MTTVDSKTTKKVQNCSVELRVKKKNANEFLVRNMFAVSLRYVKSVLRET